MIGIIDVRASYVEMIWLVGFEAFRMLEFRHECHFDVMQRTMREGEPSVADER